MVDDWQVAEYLHAFIEGTVTKPSYGNLDWSKEAASGIGETEVQEEVEAAAAEESTD